DPPQELDAPVGARSREVARPVEAGSRRTGERIRNEDRRRPRRLTEGTTAPALPPNVQLSRRGGRGPWVPRSGEHTAGIHALTRPPLPTRRSSDLDPPQELDAPVGARSREVARPVEAGSRRTGERIRNEDRRRPRRLTEVTTAHALPANVQLSGRGGRGPWLP